MITSDEECYRLKIFTHPLSYGKFDMSVVVSSGGVEERAPISLKVRKVETTSAGTTTSPISTIGLGQSSPKLETETSETAVPSETESCAATSPSTGGTSMEGTQTLVTAKEALAAIAAVLGLVLLLLLLRKR